MGVKNESPVDKWMDGDGLVLIEAWARDGFTQEEIANKIGISLSSLKRWRKQYPQIEAAISRGKEVVDYLVENALLKSALGFTTTKTTTYIGFPDKNGNRKTRKEIVVEEVAPNVTACMAWLNNRKPDQWKRNRDNVISTEDKDNNITINIIKKGKDEENDVEWDVETSKQSKKGEKGPFKKAQDNKGAQSTKFSDEELEWLNE